MFLYSLSVLHRQVLGHESVLSDMRRATTQDPSAVEHQVWNLFIVILCVLLWFLKYLITWLAFTDGTRYWNDWCTKSCPGYMPKRWPAGPCRTLNCIYRRTTSSVSYCSITSKALGKYYIFRTIINRSSKKHVLKQNSIDIK